MIGRIVEVCKRYREELTGALAIGLYCLIRYVLSVPCPIVYATGVSCPGCGMTRALISLLRLDLAGALCYHPLIFYVIPAIPAYVIMKHRGRHRACRILLLLSVALLLGVYLWRMFLVEDSVLVCDPSQGVAARIIGYVF